MELHKQAKATKILRSRKQREVSNAWIYMAQVLKTLRVKDQILKENLRFLEIKWALQRW
jgi:hypothetical protein